MKKINIGGIDVETYIIKFDKDKANGMVPVNKQSHLRHLATINQVNKCIKCKLMDCVEVCPVDCFYEGKNMLVIKPDECIDCGVCEPECPVDAIISDNDDKDKKLSLIHISEPTRPY